MLFADGKQYIGEYEKDVRSGEGKFIWPDGRKYEGQWVDGKQHGEGHYTGKDGVKRKGLWIDGERAKWLDENEIESMASTNFTTRKSMKNERYSLDCFNESIRAESRQTVKTKNGSGSALDILD